MKKKQNFLKFTALFLLVILFLSTFSILLPVSAQGISPTSDTIFSEKEKVTIPNNVLEEVQKVEVITEKPEEVTQPNNEEIKDSNKDDVSGLNQETMPNNQELNTQESIINPNAPVENSVTSANLITASVKLLFNDKKLQSGKCESDVFNIVLTNTDTKEIVNLPIYRNHKYAAKVDIVKGTYDVEISPNKEYSNFKLESDIINFEDSESIYEIQIKKASKQNWIKGFLKDNLFFLIILVGLFVGLGIIKRKQDTDLTKASKM